MAPQRTASLAVIMDVFFIGAIIYFAILTQAISGSGLALVAMPLLVQFLEPVTAASLVALMALTTQLIMITRYRRSLSARGLWRLMVGSLIGIPLGVVALARLDAEFILTALGIILVAYSLYSLFGPQLPEIRQAWWGFPFGFVSGLLHGAYNTGGPPYVIYGVGRRWTTTEFKANLQALLMVNSVSVVIAHLIAGHYTGKVLQTYASALPLILLGALTGFWLDRYVNERLFRRIVLILLLIIGLRMLLD